MAMKHDDRDLTERKVSSLSDDTLTPLSHTSSGLRKQKGKKEKSLPGRRRFSGRGLVVDLALLLLLVGLGVGIWFGYGAVKEGYAPTWETRDVEFCVEIRDLDYDLANELLASLPNHGLWHTAAADGDYLGSVREVRAVLGVTEEGREIMTLYLTVYTQANYRKGEGYYVGKTRLLAGEMSMFRAEGMIAEGMLVSVKDLSEEAA